MLPEDIDPTGLREGKKKSPKSRLAAYERIHAEAIAIGVARASHQVPRSRLGLGDAT
jgi:hypothetical protein